MSMFSYQKPLPHYYGDITRVIFIVIGVIMLLGLPRMTEVLQLSVGYPIVALVVIALAAGFTSPKQSASLVFNMLVSALGLAAFIYISWFMNARSLDGFFLFVNQLIAVLFLVALYLSIKSYRGYHGS